MNGTNVGALHAPPNLSHKPHPTHPHARPTQRGKGGEGPKPTLGGGEPPHITKKKKNGRHVTTILHTHRCQWQPFVTTILIG